MGLNALAGSVFAIAVTLGATIALIAQQPTFRTAGVVVPILLSIGAAYLFQQARNQALWEGLLAIAAAISVASLTVHMWRTSRRIKHDIEGHLRTSALRTGAAAFLGVFGFTLLMITREGMETALLMGALLFQVKTATVIGGAVAGRGRAGG